MKYILYIFCLLPITMSSQDKIEGIITEKTSDNTMFPLAGANVFWMGTSVGTVTDIDGKFSIPYQENYKKLIVSFIGFKTDTLTIESVKYIKHELKATSDLDEITLTARKQASSRSYMQAQNILTVSSDELLKAACCNLSESFETNPSIDVNFTDALTGARQIKMLGLTSKYILITTENIPSIRGASQAFGLSFIPGTWVESIQITKGAGSVVNGFESIAGQINTELRKPSTDDRLFVNFYGANSERMELNTHINTKVSEHWDTGFYIHGNSHKKKHDVNNDGFMDMPLYEQINVMNRWQYTNPEKGLVSFINVRYLNDSKQSGQLDFDPDTDKFTTNSWGSEIDTERFEMTSKLGYVNPELPWQILGAQLSFSSTNQISYYGLNLYDINHNSWYSNVIYNTIISDSRHKIKTGLDFTYDHYDELAINRDFERSERSFGGFFEYAFDDLSNFSMTAGLRFDTHNLLGEFVTPRLHVRYTPWEKSAFKASVGRGKRSANIFAENQSIFATSRSINILDSGGRIYGLDPEIAWNYGISYLQGFNLFGRKADITLDFYKTDFKNQVVVDWENANELNFYNLQGESYANSFQVELNYDMFERFAFRTAYKYYDVQTQYQVGKRSKPLTPEHRFFANASYETDVSQGQTTQWKFDATYNWLSEQRFSSTAANPEAFQLPEESPTVGTLNAQITRVFSPRFEVYLGGENITNVRQNNPILGAEDPFGPNFDTSFVYGPIFGSLYYAGLRFRIP
ncbi:TonB-dependent receptor [Subsaximicrobium wynnwilliamsii]|uniref:TonB-dependent receptor n=1 Tax=Subsaximicrobium wynnwilliamsii TaxID=291179 RepID=A0A5C6ZNI1_9FLAO|nr:TonB-dependent receptor [Subsaximicrobium wynnwilliamsii]TXD84558.1 TonB-dependent receptor [Subsaximicrobium wynnwilliamsii]TXD90240.1 TonB-dependent receptor [Subsaximicrobium wynnwilliamsii]TXE04291.1 TonB-dependent receptor [Subsaximicrobium wynnwilliamsii]